MIQRMRWRCLERNSVLWASFGSTTMHFACLAQQWLQTIPTDTIRTWLWGWESSLNSMSSFLQNSTTACSETLLLDDRWCITQFTFDQSLLTDLFSLPSFPRHCRMSVLHFSIKYVQAHHLSLTCLRLPTISFAFLQRTLYSIMIARPSLNSRNFSRVTLRNLLIPLSLLYCIQTEIAIQKKSSKIHFFRGWVFILLFFLFVLDLKNTPALDLTLCVIWS